MSFAVKDIMVSIDNLTYAPCKEDASAVSDRNPDFNIIPIRQGNKIADYYDRGLSQIRPITVHDLIRAC
jgi:hypothetical protein